jgi:hypothetical protein
VQVLLALVFTCLGTGAGEKRIFLSFLKIIGYYNHEKNSGG